MYDGCATTLPCGSIQLVTEKTQSDFKMKKRREREREWERCTRPHDEPTRMEIKCKKKKNKTEARRKFFFLFPVWRFYIFVAILLWLRTWLNSHIQFSENFMGMIMKSPSQNSRSHYYLFLFVPFRESHTENRKGSIIARKEYPWFASNRVYFIIGRQRLSIKKYYPLQFQVKAGMSFIYFHINNNWTFIEVRAIRPPQTALQSKKTSFSIQQIRKVKVFDCESR